VLPALLRKTWDLRPRVGPAGFTAGVGVEVVVVRDDGWVRVLDGDKESFVIPSGDETVEADPVTKAGKGGTGGIGESERDRRIDEPEPEPVGVAGADWVVVVSWLWWSLRCESTRGIASTSKSMEDGIKDDSSNVMEAGGTIGAEGIESGDGSASASTADADAGSSDGAAAGLDLAFKSWPLDNFFLSHEPPE
jgi:hypothetical protein